MGEVISKPMPHYVPCRYNCGRFVGLPQNMKIGTNSKVLIPCAKCSKEHQYYDKKIKGK